MNGGIGLDVEVSLFIRFVLDTKLNQARFVMYLSED